MLIVTIVRGLEGAVLLYILYAFCRSAYSSWRHASKARDLGCKVPVVQKNYLPFGLDEVYRALKADKAMNYCPYVHTRFHDAGSFTFQTSMLGTTSLVTADEKNIQAMLATQFNDFDLGVVRRKNLFPLLGNGIFTQDGQSWQHSRAMLRPQFAREQISDLDLEERHVQNLMLALSATSGGWTDEVNLQTLFFRLTLDSATEFLFGQSVNSQLTENPAVKYESPFAFWQDEKVFAQAFDQSQKTLATRIRLKDKYWMHEPQKFLDDCKSCHDFVDHFVRIALSQDPKEKLRQNDERYIFLEALAAHTQDPIELRSQMINILLAGRDTTASLLGWLFYRLARDPVRYAKLRRVILDNFGDYDKPSGITFAALKGCRYLQHSLNETLRLYPAVPMNIRVSNKDTTLPRGGGPDGMSPIFVPKDTQVDYLVHVLHRRPDIWGPDADEFNPERWDMRKVGWEFVPFNGGPRICIGQQFALTEASYVTVRLLQRFDQIENLDSDPTTKHNFGLTSCSGTGVKVRIHVASE